MARCLVVAVAKGYVNGKLQMPGDRFEIADEAFSKNWMERVGSAASTAPDNPPPSAPDGPVAIPADWRTMHWKHRVALAKAISGLDASADEALRIIGAEADARDALARQGKPPAAAGAPDLSDAALVAEAERVAKEAEDASAAAGDGGSDHDEI